MSSSSTFHPGLTFATLVVQFAAARGGVVRSLDPRRKGGSEPGDPDEHTTSSNTGGSTASKPTSSLSHSVNSTSSTSTTSSSSSSFSITSSSSISTNSPSPTALSTLPPTPLTRSDITTAGIVGVVIGSVAIVGLAFMIISKCIRRTRKTNGRIKGAPFFRVGSKSPVRPRTPVTEMSQTQSSPIITSAVAAGLTSHPILTRYSQSTNTTTSLSPLFPAASLERTRSDASTSEGSPNSAHGHIPLSDSTHDTLSYVSMSSVAARNGGSPVLSLLPIISAAAAANAPPPAVHLPEQSVLHRSLTLHQKSLEEDVKSRDVGHMDIDRDGDEKGEDAVNDPPPSYDA